MNSKLTYNKSDLVSEISSSLGLNVKNTSDALDQFLKLITTRLIISGRAEIRGFGSFSKKTIRPRKFINPKTKRISYLSETYTIYFNQSKKFFDDLKF